MLIERPATYSYCRSHVSAQKLAYHVSNRCKIASAVRAWLQGGQTTEVRATQETGDGGD